MGQILDFYIDNDRFKDVVNMDVIRFIDEVSSFPDRNSIANDSIDHLFCAGYCYYFANMLKMAFGGKVCWVQDRGHIVWIDCDEDCSFEALQSKIAYDITGIFDDYERLWPVEYLDGIIVDYMHNGKEFHLNQNLKDWCDFYKVTECFALDVIWGIMPDDNIMAYYSNGMNYVSSAYQYWLLHDKELRLIFEYIKRHDDKLFFPRHNGAESYLEMISKEDGLCRILRKSFSN